jgi:hypothetical protein
VRDPDPDDVHAHLFAYAGAYLAALWRSWLRRSRTARTPAVDEVDGISGGEGTVSADKAAPVPVPGPAPPGVRRQLFPMAATAATVAGSEVAGTVWAAALRRLPPTLRALDPLAQRAVAVLLVR